MYSHSQNSRSITGYLVRIENKHTVPGSVFQINLHDGRNILIKKNEYSSGDVLKIELPGQKIITHYLLGEGAVALMISGKHSGELGTVTQCEIKRGTEPSTVSFKEGYFTIKKNVFVVGKGTAEIKLPEVSVV
jgi:small subunit ribosomal protein S4e